jgi:hypothetical protein
MVEQREFATAGVVLKKTKTRWFSRGKRPSKRAPAEVDTQLDARKEGVWSGRRADRR